MPKLKLPPFPAVPPKLHLLIALTVATLGILFFAAVITLIALIASSRQEAVMIACVNALMWLGLAAVALVMALQITMAFGRPDSFSATVGGASISADFDGDDPPR